VLSWLTLDSAPYAQLSDQFIRFSFSSGRVTQETANVLGWDPKWIGA